MPGVGNRAECIGQERHLALPSGERIYADFGDSSDALSYSHGLGLPTDIPNAGNDQGNGASCHSYNDHCPVPGSHVHAGSYHCACTCINSRPCAHRNTHADLDSDTVTDCHSYAASDPHTHSDTVTDYHSYAASDPHTHSDTVTDCHSYAASDPHTHGDTITHGHS